MAVGMETVYVDHYEVRSDRPHMSCDDWFSSFDSAERKLEELNKAYPAFSFEIIAVVGG
jgi:hypothetical protein